MECRRRIMTDDEIKAALTKAQENWKMPTELARSTPREVALTVKGIALSCLAVLALGGGVFLAAWLYAEGARQGVLAQRMATEGALTSGTVLDVGPAHDKESRRKVRYRYEVNGQSYTASINMGSKGARTLQ